MPCACFETGKQHEMLFCVFKNISDAEKAVALPSNKKTFILRYYRLTVKPVDDVMN